MNSAQRGRRGEDAAARYLTAQGWRLLARGFRVRGGELDLVGEKDGVLVFFEVKTRSPRAWDDGRQAVNGAKQRRLRLAAGHFLARWARAGTPCRFDVLLVRDDARCEVVEHIQGAF